MTPKPSISRLNLFRELPDAYRAMNDLEGAVASACLEPRLLALVRTRVSQLNGCAFCLDMHHREAREAGEHAQRLDVLCAWREVPFFDERERAALALGESLTLAAERGLDGEAWSAARRLFEPQALAGLVFAIAAINAWNRLSLAAGLQPPDRQGSP